MGKKYISNIILTYLLKCCFIVFYLISCVTIISSCFLVHYLELFNPRLVPLLSSIIVPDLTFKFGHRPVVRVVLRGARLRNRRHVSREIILLFLLVTSCSVRPNVGLAFGNNETGRIVIGSITGSGLPRLVLFHRSATE